MTSLLMLPLPLWHAWLSSPAAAAATAAAACRPGAEYPVQLGWGSPENQWVVDHDWQLDVTKVARAHVVAEATRGAPAQRNPANHRCMV
jgi:hypothetical protein